MINKAKILVQDSAKGKVFDLSEVTESFEWNTTLIEQPGKVTLSFVKDDSVAFSNGSVLRIKVDGVKVFYGYIFTQKITNGKIIEITAYDSLRYLQNKDTYVVSDMTCTQLFNRICTSQKLPHKVVHSSTYKVPAVIHDNKSYYEMLQSAYDQVLAYKANWFIVRDNFGTLEQVNLAKLKTNLFIGDKSLLSEFEYEKSIDKDTYNQVKLIKEIKNDSKVTGREVYIEKSSANIQKWGLLQYFETVDEEANKAQIIERARMLLKLKNRQTRTLKLTCIGDFRVREGTGIVIGINALSKEGLKEPQNALVYSCTHKVSGNIHTMDLELEIDGIT